jgi:hypothetical protein
LSSTARCRLSSSLWCHRLLQLLHPPLLRRTTSAVEDAYPELSEGDSLPAPEIQLHIIINIVSRLNAVEDFSSLSVKELLLHEFLLDQILFLQESLESCLVPRVIEELLCAKLVAPPPSIVDIPSPLAVGGQGGGGVSSGCLHP